MNLFSSTIVPISEARAKLSNLVDKAKGKKMVLLTKGGKPKAALIDIEYLKDLTTDLEKVFGKTYIDPQALPLTRRFSRKEIDEWLKEDQL